MSAPSVEAALVGAMFLDSDIIPEVRGVVSVGDLSSKPLREIASAMIALHLSGQPVDVVTVADSLQARDQLTYCGGAEFLGQLIANTPTAANWRAYAERVSREAQRRRAIAYLESSRERLQSEDPAIVLGELRTWMDGGVLTAPVPEFTTLDLIDAGFEAVRRSATDALSIGLAPVDKMIGGLLPGRLYVPTGRTSTGKSAFMIHAANHLASRGAVVGIVSLEMGAAEISLRLFAQRYELNLTAMTRRWPGAAEALDAAYQKAPMSDLSLFVDDSTTDLSGIIARAMDWHHRHRIQVLFVDYLGLVGVRSNAPRHERVGEVSRALKLTAKRLAIPVVAAAQLNREPDKDDRRPRLSDIRDSGAIEQDADCVIALNPISEPDSEGRTLIEIGVLKNRSGPHGWLSPSVVFNGRTQRFETPERN